MVHSMVAVSFVTMVCSYLHALRQMTIGAIYLRDRINRREEPGLHHYVTDR